MKLVKMIGFQDRKIKEEVIKALDYLKRAQDFWNEGKADEKFNVINRRVLGEVLHLFMSNVHLKKKGDRKPGFPGKPDPEKPGVRPTKPGLEKPGVKPTKPDPEKPGVKPTKPDPEKPGVKPIKPDPKKPERTRREAEKVEKN